MAELISGALPDNASQADTPFDSTTGEVLGATASEAWNSLPTVSLAHQNQRNYNTQFLDPDAPPGYADNFEPPINGPQISPDDANTMAKQGGATGLKFSSPIAASSAQDIIDEHVRAQQNADIIDRRAGGIMTGSVARFGVGALVSLADPLNDVAMMIPAAPEAFVAEKLAAASGVLERTLIRGAAGAANGAAGMAALEPLQYGIDKGNLNDWSAGEALRQIAFGAAAGAAGHMLLGGLFGDAHPSPETSDAMLRASVAQVLADKPVDVGAIGEVGEVTAPAARAFEPAAEEPTTPGEAPVVPPDPAEVKAQQVADATTAAQDMATRAREPSPDPVIAQAERANAAAVDTAPKVEPVQDARVAEATQLANDAHQQLRTAIAAGHLNETVEMKAAFDAADAIDGNGKAAQAAASCLAFRGF
jgi:hypothetical protein